MRVLSGVVYMTKVEDREQSLEEHHRKKYALSSNVTRITE